MLKTWKKAVSLVLVFALSMMVCVPAFAVPKSNATPTKDLLLITENQAEYDLSLVNQSPDLVIDIVELDNDLPPKVVQIES
jgi:hypothetical protein